MDMNSQEELHQIRFKHNINDCRNHYMGMVDLRLPKVLSRKMLNISLIVLLCFWVSLFFFIPFGYIHYLLPDKFFSLLLFTLVLVGFLKICLEMRIRIYFKKEKYFNNSGISMHFFYEHFEVKEIIKSESSLAVKPYSDLYKIIKNKKYYFLIFSKHVGIPVPKKHCSPELLDFLEKIRLEHQNSRR